MTCSAFIIMKADKIYSKLKLIFEIRNRNRVNWISNFVKAESLEVLIVGACTGNISGIFLCSRGDKADSSLTVCSRSFSRRNAAKQYPKHFSFVFLILIIDLFLARKVGNGRYARPAIGLYLAAFKVMDSTN